MSNTTLKSRIRESLDRFRAGKANLDDIISAVESNGAALENMPYELIKEIGTIEYRLTIAKFAEDEDCDVRPESAIESVEIWLSKIPD